MTRPPFVLASASPARLRLLHDAGLDPIAIVSGVDEAAVTAVDVSELVGTLARLKAQAVVARSELPAGSLVIGCDSLLEIDGVGFGKPGTPEVALNYWTRMRGRSGRLLTGHHLIDQSTGNSAATVTATTVHFRSTSDTEVAAYIASGEPLSVAGGFTLDGLGAAFVERIEGDPSNVIGLSIPTLASLLNELGRSIVDLWPTR